MAKKPYKHTERDEKVRCVVCNRPLKKNVVERKVKTPKKCYKHHTEEERARRNNTKQRRGDEDQDNDRGDGQGDDG